MKLDDIHAEWAQDSKVNPADLGNSALAVAKLHNKYYQILSRARLNLQKLRHDYKELKHEKRQFYIDGPTEEQIDKGWELPPKGRILKADVSDWLEADPDLRNLALKIAYVEEKVNVLDSIIRMIDRMGFNIKTAVDYERFKAGG